MISQNKNNPSYFSRIILAFVLGAFFVVAIALAEVGTTFAQQDMTASERADLEAELAQLEHEIKIHEEEARRYRAQGNNLTSEINGLDSKIAKLNAQIQYINTTLSRLNRDIAKNEVSIITTEQKIDRQRAAIASALQTLYAQEQTSLVAILLKSPNLSAFFDDLNSLMAVQSHLTVKVREVTALKNELLAHKDDLATQKTEASTFRAFQESQKTEVASAKEVKKELLDVTKDQEARYQQIAEARKVEAAQIRSRLFQLLGGGEMTFQQAYEFAKNAQDLTGVTASFLLATLDRESALGRNVGSCTYHTAMAPGPPESRRDDVTPFLQITASLGLDPETTLVSCANSDGAYGGAMGPSQFIPTTWVLYKDKVASLTGSNPASPWRNSDAFIATALLLKDNLNACASEYSGDTQIRCAAARYYAGGYYKSHMWAGYGSGTLARKNQFDADIATITE
ncbi:MAG: hypothetical protein COU11_03505 [Candidatus Harrisonbacteria bacterium CG10_big_fil_rev_8_21_14_0_10_49_15]|uniref:Transglycosylase SLT domain-containing protein n=1 Tax=Candidatus Harrisonbacteria bacterium CG10_big_fil_rev_8_21_14_0_10_49_15 TaxID=1974587 RepID=A0A2H0UKG0_9BACT|nr:MAG: hypothetical protein COU11_03505 [Candidatus Harrisonbacteria bacterium CG10_big_fil_rev_8_21_14_0_10_49_15]